MKFTYYNTIQEFAGDVTTLLKKQAIQNNLFFHNINGALKNEKNDCRLMTTVKNDNGEILLAAIQKTEFLPMLIYETDNIRNNEAVVFFAEALVNHNIDVNCIISQKDLAKSFCDAFCNLTQKTYENNKNLVLYACEKTNQCLLPNGSFRLAGAKDMFYLPYWFADFEPACNAGPYNLDYGTEKAFNRTEKGLAYIWEDDGTPVAVAVKVRSIFDCAFIGDVYTPPHFRRKGYSTACVYNLVNIIFSEGYKFCALYADKDNPFSDRVYQKVGFKAFFQYEQYKFKKKEVSCREKIVAKEESLNGA